LAGLGTNEIKDPEILFDWFEFGEIIRPNLKNKELYDKYFEEYKKVYLNLKENMKVINTI
jgi:xylulokinase